MVPTAIKLVSFNTYLISKRFNENRVTFPEKRAARIRQFVLEGRNDLCFLQEVWGSGLPELTAKQQHQHHQFVPQNMAIPPHRAPLLFGAAVVSEMINSMYLQWQETGGLYDISTNNNNAKQDIACRYRKKHTFTKSRSKSRKGVEATLWDVPQWGANRSLLVLNTHLDPWHPANRSQQVREILDFLKDTVRIIDEGTMNSQQQQRHDWSQTGVLIVGDFNIKAGTDEYKETFVSNNPEWKDYFEDEKEHTYAIENSLVAYPEDCGRIDYIFGVESCGPSHSFMTLNVVSRSIRKEPIGTESSDHYALVVDLVPK